MQAVVDALSAKTVSDAIRHVLEEIRSQIAVGEPVPDRDDILRSVNVRLQSLLGSTLRRVINGTGIILHTGLGRSPLAKEAISAIVDAAGYCSLEFNLESGERGDRQQHIEELLCRLTGAEAALVVNNNAAALYLTLNVLGYRKEVIVSRGQLIEIGGSFRLPDIMARSGARLIEVGTTNRTRISDYRSAISDKTALLLHCHTSNYRIVGFSESVPIEKLAKLGNDRGIPVVDDIGNGLLWDWADIGLPSECNAKSSVQSGADLVLMSGDKALGGPQAGIIVGKKKFVDPLRRNPLARVLRPEKLMLAGLAATIRLYLDWQRVPERVPVWKMLKYDTDILRRRAQRLLKRLEPLCAWAILEIRDNAAQTGSGTLPAIDIPSVSLCLLPVNTSAADWARRLRTAAIPVVGTVRQNIVWLDLRTIAESEDDELVRIIEESLRETK